LLLALTACSFEHAHVSSDSGATTDTGSGSDTGPCRATAVAASGGHTCIVRSDGRVRCWGLNNQGEVGLAPTASETCPVSDANFPCMKSPFDPMVPASVAALGLGDQHSCAIADDKVYCWGANDSGQFGNGDAGNAYSPVEITERAGAIAIAGGKTHTCSLGAAGTVSCSGGNTDGEVGNGTTVAVKTPFAAKSGANAVGTGYVNSYALLAGVVWGWGDNADRQIDNSGTDPRATPLQIGGVSSALTIAGGIGHACAVLANQSATCWGANGNGQLGRNYTSNDEGPGAVTIVTSISELSAGVNHTCVRRTDNTVVCWGESYGLGATLIPLPAPAARIASGSYHDCAVLDDGSVWCWGRNTYGQLGNGVTSTTIDNTPQQAVVCP
jgi:alpha-tubulin suppressor-like RCC1 family protein